MNRFSVGALCCPLLRLARAFSGNSRHDLRPRARRPELRGSRCGGGRHQRGHKRVRARCARTTQATTKRISCWPGDYQVTAEMQGFKKTVRSGINLPIGARVEIELRLAVGDTTETVSVTAEAPLLEVSSISAGRVMENRSVMDLPTFNNSPLMLIKLVPGIQASANRRYNGVNALGGTNEAHNAGNVGGNDWSIDGVPNIGNGYSAAYLPYSTTIQEFKVESTNFDASIGHTTGMSVSVMTKGGTNSLHGALTEQHWQQRWNGTRFFVKQQYYRNIAAAEAAGDTARAEELRNSPKQPSGHSNNYAATLGGPIVIPKLVERAKQAVLLFQLRRF